ncbi:MAG: stress response translation initiation inhibitor YciH [Candidatus Omnitrophica bacterium]|nr:stress response translation initiation inhibitor YciH [Candidatus Omnitrophota bacterium]
MENKDLGSRLVYSTAQGKICQDCAQPVNNCICHKVKKNTMPDTDGVVRLRYEIKGRQGKGMTLISGLPLHEEGLLEIAKNLKQRFGTGGAVKDFIIQLQGDFRRQAAQELSKLGYNVK